MASAGHQESPLTLPADSITSASATAKPASRTKRKQTLGTSSSWKQPGQFPCSECGLVIKYLANFKRHMRMHQRGKTTKCSKCGKMFRDQSELRNHMESSAHVAPKVLYTCASCGGRFKSQRELLHHSHDVSAFPCDICRRKFQTVVVRAAHRRRHFWRGLPRCRVCSATFACEQHLSRHIRNHESETSEPVRY